MGCQSREPEYRLHPRHHMGKTHAIALVTLLGVLILGWLLFREWPRGPRPGSPGGEAAPPGSVAADSTAPGEETGTGALAGPAAPGPLERMDSAAVVRGDVVYEPRDIEIFRETVAWARAEAVDTMPIGQIIVRVGRRFVGSPYTPHTLDLPGPERLVVDLREFDCVTYVENVLALARVIRASRGGDLPAFAAFTEELRRIRYRDGRIDGYASRLHYFSDWIRDNARLGLVRDVTEELGGQRDTEPIDFMSSHADAYSQLRGHPERLERIRAVEQRLSESPRYVIPQDRVGDVAGRIRDGDIIAMASSVPGLDVAHTGVAIHENGQVHLMNAPLVGKSVEISTLPLARRILRIDGQDGIMVARPL